MIGILRRVKGFFVADDPTVKLVANVDEPEALMCKELLDNGGVPAYVKNSDSYSATYGATPLLGVDIYVKRSDVERAEEILGLSWRPTAGEGSRTLLCAG